MADLRQGKRHHSFFMGRTLTRELVCDFVVRYGRIGQPGGRGSHTGHTHVPAMCKRRVTRAVLNIP